MCQGPECTSSVVFGGERGALRMQSLPSAAFSGPGAFEWAGHTDDVMQVVRVPKEWAALKWVSASRDRTVRLWDRTARDPLCTLCAHTLAVSAVCCLREHSGMICSGSRAAEVAFWDAETQQCLRMTTVANNTVTAIVEGADPALAGHAVVQAGEDRVLRIWDVREKAAVATMDQTEQFAKCMAAEQNYIVTGSNGFDESGVALNLWDLRQRRCVQTAHPHSQKICAVAMTSFHVPSYAQFAVSASADRTMVVYDWTTQTVVERVPTADTYGVAMHIGGGESVSAESAALPVIWCGMFDGSARSWTLDPAGTLSPWWALVG